MGKVLKTSCYGKAVSKLPVCLKIAEQMKAENAQVTSGTTNWNLLLMPEKLNFESMKHLWNELNNGHVTVDELLMKSFFRCFLISEINSTFRDIVVSILQRIISSDDMHKIVSILSAIVRNFLNCILCDLNAATGRHARSIITYCASSNFTIGWHSLIKCQSEVLQFLDKYLHYLITILREPSESVVTDVTHTVKCVSSVIKKLFHENPNQLSYRHAMSGEDVFYSLFKSCEAIFQIKNFNWDCYSATGMALVTILLETKKGAQLLSEIEDLMLSPIIENRIQKPMSICNAVLVLLTQESPLKDLLSNITEQSDNLLTVTALQCIKEMDGKGKIVSDQLITTRCYAQWSKTFLSVIQIYPSYIEKKEYMSEILLELLEVATNRLEHPSDVIRHQANEFLANVLKIGEFTGSTEFSLDLLGKILHQSWRNRSTLSALNCLLQHIESCLIFKKMPYITEKLLSAMQHQSLAPYAAETYKVLAVKYSQQCNITSRLGNEEFQNIFLNPMINAMCQSSRNGLPFLVNYGFVKLLKSFGQTWAFYLLQKFKERIFMKNFPLLDMQTYVSFLHCLKVSVSHGTFRYSQDDHVLNNLLKSSLVHQNDEIRHLAFSLLCESPKPSSLLDKKTLKAIQYALPFNLSCQDSAFRQKLLTSVKKLLLQLKSNILHLQKTNSNDDMTECYQGFLKWMINFTCQQLNSSAPYPKRITAVTVFVLLVDLLIGFDFTEALVSNILFTTNSVQSLFHFLSDPYPSIRESAYSVLTEEKTLRHVKSQFHFDWIKTIYSHALNQAHNCSQPENCVDASYHMRLYASFMSSSDCSKNVILLEICSLILNLLRENLCLARKSLYHVANSSPMYGLLHCLRNLLHDIQFKNLNEKTLTSLREQISIMISTCFDISAVVLPVVGSVSPEGHLPEVEVTRLDGVTGGADDAWNELPETIKSHIIGESIDEQSARVISQKVLICCWRNAKESSLLLQEVLSLKYPLDSAEDVYDGALSWKQLIEIGEHLKSQLMEARHRGAFEVAYYVFKTYCPRLWKSTHTELNCIPVQWLQSVLSVVKDPKKSHNVCATRRSAGLPFFMQALLSGNKSAQARGYLEHVMSTLLKLCKRSDESSLLSKVHSLNILRGLVKDSSLGEEILPFVSECVIVALSGFESPVWGVRNSSTLLFSTLFTRVFGVKQDRDDIFSLKNRLSGNEFFSRLPGMHAFLLENLRNITTDFEKGNRHALRPILHPILLLLSRVYPSTIPSSSNTGLSEFIPLLIKCRASAVYKSRMAAAISLSSIVSSNQFSQALQNCCNVLKEDVAITFNREMLNAQVQKSLHNKIHGGLLQVKELLTSFINNNSSFCSSEITLNEVVFIVQGLHHAFMALTGKLNRCPLTKATALHVFFQLQQLKQKSPDLFRNEEIEEDSQKIFTISTDILLSDEVCRSIPGSPFLIKAAADAFILLSLRVDAVLQVLESILEKENVDGVYNVLKSLWKNWHHLKTSKDDLLPLETKILDALLHRTWEDKITTLMYKILSRCTSEKSVAQLFSKSLEASAKCNSSQMQLLVSLINFQTVCTMMMLVQEIRAEELNVLERWSEVLTQSTRSFEHSEAVRLAVANSVLLNISIFTRTDEDLRSIVLRLWEIIFSLLNDEESDIRMVASRIVHGVRSNLSIGTELLGEICNEFQPCIDSLALHHAIRLMIITQGRDQRTECRSLLERLKTHEKTKVSEFTKKYPDQSVDENVPTNVAATGLFDGSCANTYYDVIKVADAAKIGLKMLDTLS